MMARQHFLSLADWSTDELLRFLSLAKETKERPQDYAQSLVGKQLGMVFQKSSTRMRVSFEAGMTQLGGSALYLSSNDLQLGRGETLADTARVLSRYVHVLMARVNAHAEITELAQYSSVPVINGLSNFNHPCQGLADYLTMWERFGSLEGLSVTYIGDGNNVCHSLMMGAAKFGASMTVGTPNGYEPDTSVTAYCMDAMHPSGSLQFVQDPVEACRDAQVIYTDSWVSMHMENEREERLRVFGPYQVNAALLEHTAPDAIFMHCLPAHRGVEVTDEVMDGPSSAVFDQAENRMHAQKALLLSLLSE